jgi:hypothetical protein
VVLLDDQAGQLRHLQRRVCSDPEREQIVVVRPPRYERRRAAENSTN